MEVILGYILIFIVAIFFGKAFIDEIIERLNYSISSNITTIIKIILYVILVLSCSTFLVLQYKYEEANGKHIETSYSKQDAEIEAMTEEELEEKVEELEEENKELKDKLDNIYQMASDRYYNYDEILDDIETESQY